MTPDLQPGTLHVPRATQCTLREIYFCFNSGYSKILRQSVAAIDREESLLEWRWLYFVFRPSDGGSDKCMTTCEWAFFFSGAKLGGRLNRQERKKRGTQGVIAGYTEITAWKKL